MKTEAEVFSNFASVVNHDGHVRMWVLELSEARKQFREYRALAADRKNDAEARADWRVAAAETKRGARVKIRRLAKLLNEGFK